MYNMQTETVIIERGTIRTLLHSRVIPPTVNFYSSETLWSSYPQGSSDSPTEVKAKKLPKNRRTTTDERDMESCEVRREINSLPQEYTREHIPL